MNYELKLHARPLNSPLNSAALGAFERDLGYSFPEDYRDFLLQWNGVYFDPEQLKKEDVVFFIYPGKKRPSTPLSAKGVTREELWNMGCSICPVYELGGLPEEILTDLQGYRRGHAFFSWSPERFWPIGSNDIGDRICVSLDAPDRGAIYYWSRPDEPLETKGQWGEMPFLYWVAPSFRTFWDVLSIMSWDQQEELEG